MCNLCSAWKLGEMSDVIFNVLFFAVIFCFLTVKKFPWVSISFKPSHPSQYSCSWFGRTLKKYQDARNEFESKIHFNATTLCCNIFNLSDQQIRQNSPNRENNQFSIYTIEHGRRTLISYNSRIPPRTPAHLVMKEELPPTYEAALRMEQSPVTPPLNSTPVVVVPRRNSATI